MAKRRIKAVQLVGLKAIPSFMVASIAMSLFCLILLCPSVSAQTKADNRLNEARLLYEEGLKANDRSANDWKRRAAFSIAATLGELQEIPEQDISLEDLKAYCATMARIGKSEQGLAIAEQFEACRQVASKLAESNTDLSDHVKLPIAINEAFRLLDMGEFEQAIATLGGLKRLPPEYKRWEEDYKKAMFHFGWRCYELGKFEMALEAFEIWFDGDAAAMKNVVYPILTDLVPGLEEKLLSRITKGDPQKALSQLQANYQRTMFDPDKREHAERAAQVLLDFVKLHRDQIDSTHVEINLLDSFYIDEAERKAIADRLVTAAYPEGEYDYFSTAKDLISKLEQTENIELLKQFSAREDLSKSRKNDCCLSLAACYAKKGESEIANDLLAQTRGELFRHQVYKKVHVLEELGLYDEAIAFATNVETADLEFNHNRGGDADSNFLSPTGKGRKQSLIIGSAIKQAIGEGKTEKLIDVFKTVASEKPGPFDQQLIWQIIPRDFLAKIVVNQTPHDAILVLSNVPPGGTSHGMHSFRPMLSDGAEELGGRAIVVLLTTGEHELAMEFVELLKSKFPAKNFAKHIRPFGDYFQDPDNQEILKRLEEEFPVLARTHANWNLSALAKTDDKEALLARCKELLQSDITPNVAPEHLIRLDAISEYLALFTGNAKEQSVLARSIAWKLIDKDRVDEALKIAHLIDEKERTEFFFSAAHTLGEKVGIPIH